MMIPINAAVEIVTEYWAHKRRFYESKDGLALYSPAAQLRKFKKYSRTKQGLRRHTDFIVEAAIRQIAAGLVDMGLENASLAKKFAEAALELDDWGNYGFKKQLKEFGLYLNLYGLYLAKWILGEEDNLHLNAALEYLSIVRKHYDPPGCTCDNEIELWTYPVPFLMEGRIDEAADDFEKIYPSLEADPKDIKKNGTDIAKCLWVLLQYLNNSSSELEKVAHETINRFHYNITGWGHEGRKKPRDHMWDDLVTMHHFYVARIRARYVTSEKNPIKIIQSIKGQ